MSDTLISPQIARELTSLTYFLAAGLAGYYVWRTPPPIPGQPSPYGLRKNSAYILLALGINKMYNMQQWLWEMARDLARAFDLYSFRWVVQIGLAALAGLVLLFFIYRRNRQQMQRRADKPLVRALGALVALVTLRTLSFHYIDLFFGLRLVGFELYWLLEWSAIGLTALAMHRSFHNPLPT